MSDLVGEANLIWADPTFERIYAALKSRADEIEKLCNQLDMAKATLKHIASTRTNESERMVPTWNAHAAQEALDALSDDQGTSK